MWTEGSESDKLHPDNKALVHEGWDSLEGKQRWCTDVLFLILLLVTWFAMTMVGFIVTGVIQDDRLPKGDPNRLTNSIDYEGNLCGIDSTVKDKPYAYYMPDTSVVCVSNCPEKNNYEAFICQYGVQSAADASLVIAWEYVAQFQCMYEIDTYMILNRCWPNVNVNTAFEQASLASQNATGSGLSSVYIYSTLSRADEGSNWYTYFMTSLYDLRAYVFGFGLGVSVFFSFLYVFFLRLPGVLFITIWSAILIIFILLMLGAWLLWDLANQWEAQTDPERSQEEVISMRIFAYIFMGASLVYFLIIIGMRKRIQLAIGVVKQACRVLGRIPVVITMPLIQAFGITCFLVPWLIYLLYMASSGEIVIETYTIEDDTTGSTFSYQYKTFQYTGNTRFAFLFMLFCWFWTSEFIIAVGQITVALSFAAWYFTRDKSKVGNQTFLWALESSTSYHLGTAAYGSLVIAVVKTIRAVVAYIQRKAKKSGNKCAEYVMCCVQCCLWCVEKCMKFLNKHAYILTAIYNDGFCRAARRAFFLLLRNVLRVIAVNMVSGFVLFIGKFVTPVATTFCCYLAIIYTADLEKTWGIIGPLIFVFVLSYWIAGMFAELFGMGIETILFCYIADEEMFAPCDRFSDEILKQSLQKTEKQHEVQEKGTTKLSQVSPEKGKGRPIPVALGGGGEEELL